jgi:predicted transcriptional regulator
MEDFIMKSMLSERHKIMAYVLNREFSYSQSAIAQLMKVSQPTVANAVKEAAYMLKIKHLQQLYIEVKNELHSKGYRELPSLSEGSLFDDDE